MRLRHSLLAKGVHLISRFLFFCHRCYPPLTRIRVECSAPTDLIVSNAPSIIYGNQDF